MVSVAPGMLEKFEEQGYVVIEGLLDVEEDIQGVIDEYAAATDMLEKQWYQEGKISRTYEGLPFDKRAGQLIIETKGKFVHHLDVALNALNLTEEDPNIHHGPAVFGLLTNPKVLDVVEQFIGPEIYVNPLNRLRIKPPERLLAEDLRKNDQIAKTFWHQDQGVVQADADSTNLLTVWIPLTEATAENGCLAMVPGSHRGGLVLHCFTEWREKGIPHEILGDLIPVPMNRGDVLFQSKFNVHGSLPNVTEDDVRISFDLRYQPVGQPTGIHFGPKSSRPIDPADEPLTWPGFVARSRAHPELELKDSGEWGRMWAEARASIIAMNAEHNILRWDPFDPRCS